MKSSMVDDLVSTVKSILKTLECPICLELLKVPVSAGCGHFFCKECVHGMLQSAYRAPCPLCKRSFTRRSVQEALQRQSVILAAKQLAYTCTNLTGIKFIAQDQISIEDLESDANVTSKKFKSTDRKSEEAGTRKRKSCENEDDVGGAKKESVTDVEMKDCTEGNKNINEQSSNKRSCTISDDEDSDLPTLSELLSQPEPAKKNSHPQVKDLVEKDLVIKLTDKASEMKTYSSAPRKASKSNVPDPFDFLLEDNSNKSNDAKSASSARNQKDSATNKKTNKNDAQKKSEELDADLLFRNKINALKNKTNEVQSDQYIMRGTDSNLKQKLFKQKKVVESGSDDKLKENEIGPSPTTNELEGKSSKTEQCSDKKLSKLKRKSVIKLQNSNTTAAASKSLDAGKDNLKDIEASPNKNQGSYTLNEVILSPVQQAKEPEDFIAKPNDDPFKFIGLTDTAVSVGYVASPLAAKTPSSLRKSPGWSRVKEVKKDFKMKKFRSLHVEKNSPNVSLKSAVSSKESASSINKFNQAHNVEDRMQNNLDSRDDWQDEDMPDEHLPMFEVGNCKKNLDLNNKQNEAIASDSHHDRRRKSLKPNSFMDKIHSQTEEFEEMDCPSVIMHKNNVNDSKNVSDMNTVKGNLGVSDPKILINNAPTVSITSSSVICAKYADPSDSIPSQNVVKAQKIICKLQNSSLNNSGLASGNESVVSDFVNAKQNALALPSHISEYQSYQSHSYHNDDNFQYVEQSQQTSQVFDFQNAVCNNIRAIVQQQQSHTYPPNIENTMLLPNVEKTKVVKRTCLTLEEVQEFFLKSSQTNSTETICSLPFFSGLFKLHVAVSDETLNISVLKVIDPAAENSSAQICTPLRLYDKCIQSSNIPFPPTVVEPSSNAGSETSRSETPDPFPYLSKSSGKASALPVLVEPTYGSSQIAKTDEIVDECNEVSLPNSDSVIKGDAEIEMVDLADEDNVVPEAEMSEIIHFPPKPTTERELIQKDTGAFEPLLEENSFARSPNCAKDVQPVPELVNLVEKPSIEENSVLTSEKGSFCETPCKTDSKVKSINSSDSVSSDEDEPLKRLELCVNQDSAVKDKKKSRLSLKKKTSFRRIQVEESSDESDLETSISDKKSSESTENKNAERDDMFALQKKLASTSERFLSPMALKTSDNAERDDMFAHPKKLASTSERFLSPMALKTSDNLKKLDVSTVGEMPSTLNSILSEDASEVNASEIVLEIEDLSDKIKSLEERLKQCGSDSLNKSGSLHHSDSEDSTDLFPQSVPPTPPKHL